MHLNHRPITMDLSADAIVEVSRVKGARHQMKIFCQLFNNTVIRPH